MKRFFLIIFLLLTLSGVAQAAGPSITSLSPTSGTVGTSVTITGTNFGATQGNSTVTFNGTAATPTFWSSTSIKAPVPSGATTGNVVVKVSSKASNGVTFTVVPNITSLSPTNGPAGTSVTITGTTFGSSQGSSTITFNGVSATPTSWSTTSIVAPVPTGATTGIVVVTVSGLASNGPCFAIPPVPCAGFSVTGNLNIARTGGHTATLLNNGLVLIAGGYDCGVECGLDSGAYAYAELYDPAKGTFAATGSMNTARTFHTATLLNNGMVLITGGAQDSFGEEPLSSAELYNPATRTFTVTGSLNTARDGHTATLMNNGQVLIAGGAQFTNFSTTYLSGAELYNPATGAFTVTGSLNTARDGHTATLMNNGQVLIAGGFNSNGNLSGAELYSPGTGAFTATGSLNTARESHTATLLNNGEILVAGGAQYNSTNGTTTYFSAAELYNPATGTFSTTGSLNSARSSHTATLLKNGMVMVAGGFNGSSGELYSAELYNPAAGTFTVTGSMTYFRSGHTATLLNNGMVLVAAGSASYFDNTAELYQLNPYPPFIASLSPISGPVGTLVTISGSNFGASQGTSTVTFNGTPGTPTSWSATSIVVPVPSSATTGSVVVTVGGFPGNGVLFTVTAGITSLAPTSGPVGTSVTITGTNFGSSQGTSTVTFNGTNATPTSWSPTSIVVPVPNAATTGNVLVTVGGFSSNGLNFTVSPAITGLSPSSGPPGTLVTISGTTFGNTQGTSTVTFNGTTASARSWRASSIITTVPNGATTGNVVVTVSGLASSGVSFTVSPYITTLSATTGPVGTSVTISGSGFGATQGTSAVTFNGTAATPTSWSTTSIAVPVPSAATSGSVVVNVSGVASNAVQFVVTPSISSLSPTLGTAGTAVTIAGTGFGGTQASSTVTFNGTSATPTSWSATSIAVSVPTGATTGNVVVTVAGATSNGVSFTVGTSPAPTISSISPSSGAVGTVVTINGANFGAAQGTVQFNGTPATVTSWSTSSIGAQVPSGATSGKLVVTTASGIASSPEESVFIVQLQISTVLPDPAPIGSTVTINGEGFGNTQGSSTVTFGSMTVSPSSWNNAQIQVPINSATMSGNIVVTVSGVASNPVLFTVGNSPGQFVATGRMSSARTSLTSTLLNTGNVLMAGGFASGPLAIASSELYNPTNGTFTSTGNLIAARELHTATLLPSGKVLVAGGFNGIGTTYSSAELYDPTTGTFSSTGSMNSARYDHVAVLLNNGQVLVAGGIGANEASAELYNPSTGTFTTTGNLNTGRYNHTATLLNNGMVLVVGGNDSNGNILSSAELYNPSTGTFTLTGTLNVARANFSATLLNNGNVLIVGGLTPNGSNTAVLGSAELYNTGTGQFTTTGNLAVAVYQHTATPLNNGQVLIAGGFGNGFTVPTAELYDPGSATFIMTGNLNAERFDHTATLLTNGNVLVAGGDVPLFVGPLASAELYETFAPTITGLSPTSGAAGTTSVTISGANFGGTQGTSTVAFNGTVAGSASSWSATSVTVTVPAGALTGNVIVTVGGQPSNAVLFVVGSGGPAPPTNLTASAASSSEIDLTWVASTTTGVAYTVFRNGFAIAANVTSTVYADHGVVPGATYVYEVEAVGPTGTSVPSNTASATALAPPAPVISSISPLGGPGGTLVTVNGSNFGSVPATVLFGSAFAQVQSWSPNIIITKVPTSLLPGLANVQVVLPNGSSNAAAFQVTAAGCPGN